MKYTLKTAFCSPCWLCTVYGLNQGPEILPSKHQIQSVKNQNLSQVKVQQLLVPILSLKVIQVVLQKAQNIWDWLWQRWFIEFMNMNFVIFFRIILENYTFFWANEIPLSFSKVWEILPSKHQIQSVKNQNLSQVKVQQLLVPILSLKVIQVVL